MLSIKLSGSRPFLLHLDELLPYKRHDFISVFGMLNSSKMGIFCQICNMFYNIQKEKPTLNGLALSEFTLSREWDSNPRPFRYE